MNLNCQKIISKSGVRDSGHKTLFRFKRRTLLLASFIKTTLFCTLGAICASNELLVGYTRWCALIGKFGICVIYSMIYLIGIGWDFCKIRTWTGMHGLELWQTWAILDQSKAAELFPTPIRSKAISFGMAICTVGGFISPLVIEGTGFSQFFSRRFFVRTFSCMTHHESVDEKHESLFIAEKLGAFMPFLIFSVISFMGVLGSIFLPGTYHKVILVVW